MLSFCEKLVSVLDTEDPKMSFGQDRGLALEGWAARAVVSNLAFASIYRNFHIFIPSLLAPTENH